MTNPNEMNLSVEEASRFGRLEAENFRLENELETLQTKLAETSERLARIQAEAADAFHAAEKNRVSTTAYLHEARAQSLILEEALRIKTEELARLRALNRRLLEMSEPSRGSLDAPEAVAAARKFVELAADIRAEEALMRGRAKYLKDQAPETGTVSAEGASVAGSAGAVSGISLGASAGTDPAAS